MRRLAPRVPCRVALTLAVLASSSPALAQTELERARARMAAADFEGAVAALDAAEASDAGLSHDELARLYADRAEAHLALGATEAMQEDLRRLATVDPHHEFGRATRPEIREAFDGIEVAQGVTLHVETRSQAGGMVLESRLAGDDAGLVRRLRWGGRPAGGSWVRGEGTSLLVPMTADGQVAYFAEALGPGGAVLASAGSEAEPLRATYAPIGGDDRAALRAGDDSGPGVAVWIGVGLGTAAVIVALVAVLAVGRGGGGETQPGAPVIFPPM